MIPRRRVGIVALATVVVQGSARGRAAKCRFEASATGRSPVEVHAHGDAARHSHDELPLVVLEVYPR
jgi:hypothetical protein